MAATAIRDWAALRYYQYELTLGLYMLYPLERAVFNSFVLLFSAFLLYWVICNLPDYVVYLVSRSQFYLTSSD